MRWTELMSSLHETTTVLRVFGDPYERDGVTVIPVAAIRGGGGGGTGGQTAEEGSGGGIGLIGHPVGAYVISDGKVLWQPALDVNRMVTLGVLGWVTVAWLIARALRRR